MRKIITLCTGIIFLFSCGQTNIKNSQWKASDNSANTDEEVTPDLKKLRKEYIFTYNNPIEFTCNISDEKFGEMTVLGKYYCLFDSGIVVPRKYNFDDTTKTFTTHNFAEDVAVIRHGDTIIKKTITKKDFAEKLPQYLKDYAVLFEPKFEGFDGNTFEFTFSISIPLTDVGQPFELKITPNGYISVTESQ